MLTYADVGMHALGEWEQLQEMAQDTWPNADAKGRERIAPLAAAAACQLGLQVA
jgi:hypothetical protein